MICETFHDSSHLSKSVAAFACGAFNLLCGACTSGPGGQPDDIRDVDALPQLRLQEERRVGSVDDPNYGFSSVGGVEVDDEGNLYVFEAQDRQIRVYREGRLVHRIGRPGKGPGEFAGSIIFGVVGDTLWVVEVANRRLTLFDRTGQLLQTVPFEEVTIPLHAAGQTALIIPAALRQDGLFISTRGPTRGAPPPGTVAEVSDTIRVPRIRFDTDGRVVDTIGSYEVPRSRSSTQFVQIGSSRYVLPGPPSAEPRIIATPDGLIRLHQGLPTTAPTFRIARLDHRGDTIRTRTFRYRPKPYPSAVLDSAAVRAVGRRGRTMLLMGHRTEILDRRPEDSAAAVATIRSRISFPPHQPPIQSYEIADDGALWLRREDLGGFHYRWTLFDRADNPIGQLELPRAVRIAWARGNILWTVEKDSLDVPWMVHYTIHQD